MIFLSSLFFISIIGHSDSCSSSFAYKGNTILHQAVIQKKDINTIKNIVNNGFDINARDKSGRTALMLAVINDYPEAVEFLTEKDTDLEAKDNFGKTVLMLAAIDRYFKYVKLFVKEGSNIEATDNLGATVLHGAVATEDNKKVVNFLIKIDSDRQAEDKERRSIIHAIDKKGRSVLDWAIRGNQLDKSSNHIDLLTRLGAKSNNKNSNWIEQGKFDFLEVF